VSLVKAEKFVLFLFPNMQNVIGGEKALLVEQVSCLVMPLPSSLSASCGMAIKIFPEDMARAVGLLAIAGISPSKLYRGMRQNHETHFEEIELPIEEKGAWLK